jgi:hypothetical protein
MLAGLLGVVGPAHLQAEPIILSGSGTFDRVCGPCLQSLLDVTVAVGDPFTLSVSFDAVSGDSDPDATIGNYDFGVGSVSLSAGNHTVTGPSGPVYGLIYHKRPGFPEDFLNLLAPLAFGVEGSLSILGSDRGGRGDWLTSDAWPTDIAATLNAAPGQYFISLYDPEGGVLAFGTSLHYTQAPAPPPVVPEPSTLLLLCTGALAAGVRRWRARTSA